MLGAIVMTLALTVGLAFLISSSDIEAIKSNWDTRRCEIPIQVSAYLFKPDDDARTRTQFATDNFSFCTRQIVNSVLQAAFAPLYAVAGQQTNTIEQMQGPLNSVRAMIANARNTFSKYMDRQYKQFTVITVLATAVWQHLLFAMGRVQAMVLSFVYLGLSLSATLQMTIRFTMKVIAIFIGILAAMIILLFFILFPFIPMILTMIVILASIGIGTADAGVFCIDPNALVYMADGTQKPLKDVQNGDLLGSMNGRGTNRVEGILSADASAESLITIHDVTMSKSHRVFYKQKWILAQEHPEAVPATKTLSRLICLNTTEHCVPLVSTKGYLFAGDWEEVDTEEGRRGWIQWVHFKLNGGHHMPSTYPTTVPLLSPKVQVHKKNVGWVPIDSLAIGDLIYGNGTYTTVKGLYRGVFRTNTASQDPEWISDGVWVRRQGRFWSHTGSSVSSDSEGDVQMSGICPITEDGCIHIYKHGQEYLVRDFTEVGMNTIEQSYSMLDMFLHKK